MSLDAHDVRVWIPARDFSMSHAFYNALGWSTAWTDGGGLAQLELAGYRFMLQDFYVEQWAHNSMVTVDVADANAWYAHAAAVIADGSFGDARVAPPQEQDFGAVVTYVWDPSGVLLHFTQWTDA
jgi:uncharacterized glyoxalase superfamily protein PhnB